MQILNAFNVQLDCILPVLLGLEEIVYIVDLVNILMVTIVQVVIREHILQPSVHLQIMHNVEYVHQTAFQELVPHNALHVHKGLKQIWHTQNAYLVNQDITVMQIVGDVFHVYLELIRQIIQAQAAPHVQREQLLGRDNLPVPIVQLDFHAMQEDNYHVHPHLIRQKDLRFA
jgi:hypothetical protein